MGEGGKRRRLYSCPFPWGRPVPADIATVPGAGKGQPLLPSLQPTAQVFLLLCPIRQGRRRARRQPGNFLDGDAWRSLKPRGQRLSLHPTHALDLAL